MKSLITQRLAVGCKQHIITDDIAEKVFILTVVKVLCVSVYLFAQANQPLVRPQQSQFIIGTKTT